jgi:Arc/MetJ-type ribon-helix-helix transcriptional regulator
LPKRRVRAENYAVSTRVPIQVLNEIEDLVKQGHYLDISDYLRDIIRRDLEQRGRMPATGQ